MADVFLSYSRDDAEVATEIVKRLNLLGYSVSWDQQLVPTGETFDRTIQKQIDDAAIVLVLWSPVSVNSKWVGKEAIYADENEKLIPAKIAECEVPFAYRSIQTAQLFQQPSPTSGPEWDKLVSWLGRVITRETNGPVQAPVAYPTDAVAQRDIQGGGNSLAALARPAGATDNTAPEGFQKYLPVVAMVGMGIAGLILAAFLVGGRVATGCLVGLPDGRYLASSTEAPITDHETCIAVDYAAFRDCEGCPEMVTLPAGEFEMGASSVDSEYRDVRPVRTVRLRRSFAVGRFEVTWSDWAACRMAGGCGEIGNSRTDRTGSLPVNLLTREDARAYVDWLRAETGEVYRLLTEAEWEYAARGGSQAIWPNGADRSEVCVIGNVLDRAAHADFGHRLKDSVKVFPCQDGYEVFAPVGSFRPNRFGLYDVIGNVGEMVEDCYTSDYSNASPFGDAVFTEECAQFVSRGGSWYSPYNLATSADRLSYAPGRSSDTRGFRVARDVE